MADTTFTFGLEGLHCASCVGRAEAALRALPGVGDARVNLANHSATVTGADAQDVVEGLEAAGYPARLETRRYHVPGMSCASCVARIEAAALAVPGVVRAETQLPVKGLTVSVLGDDAALRRALDQAGYPANEIASHSAEDDPSRPLLFRFVLAGLLTLPVFASEMGGHLYPPLHHTLAAFFGHQTLVWMQFLLTACVLAGPGAGFFRRGIPGLLRARPDMDALVALGAGAAFFYSAIIVLLPGLLPGSGVYFEAAAVIVTLILMGRWLEARAKGRTGDAVRRLIALRPDQAEVLGPDGFVSRPIAEVRVGDEVRVRPGGRVPVDGTVTDGETHIDEAMLTGEPIPVLKRPDDTVHAGTLATTGSVQFRAAHVGEDTVLARIAAMTAQAQAARLPVEALVNRITAWFVPAVIAIALVTFGIWLALVGPGPAVVSAVSVLIIACPCAMGLATPMSVMVGTGRAAEQGVLFHKGTALQRLQDARVIAFDKTGTLTMGTPRLIAQKINGEASRVLSHAAAVEAQSEHPIARAIVAEVEAAPAAHAFTATPGEGAQAQVEGESVVVGNSAMLSRAGIAKDAELIAFADAQARGGATPVHVAIDGVHVGTLAIGDPIRDGAADAIAALKATGRRVAMISGDTAATADFVAGQLGINIVVAGVKPDGKVAALAELRAEHGPVAFVGDGINDAPALAAADIGLAVNGASDVAIEAADVVMMSAEPAAVLRALRISRATLRNIWQNLGWAFGYNTLLIPVAAGVLVPLGGPQLSPQLAALAMALSSVFVVSNGLRLRRA